ncbi:MAG: acyltransferase, partial [Glaciimonas sp.]|nr:acyltransferase [Glaciimonas sp.]
MHNTKRLHYLDTWRLIAVLLVIFHHIGNYSELGRWINPELALHLPRLGKFGVLIFFCISGFVICKGLINEQSLSKVSMTGFYLRRGLRIIPPLFLYLAVVAILSILSVIQVSFGQLVRSAMFVCNFHQLGSCSWFGGHTWSLAFEEQFYLIFPVFFTIFYLTKSPRLLLYTLSGFTLCSLVFYITDWPTISDYLTTFSYMLAGCACALYWSRLQTFIRNLPLIIWVLSVIVMFTLVGFFPLSKRYETIMYITIMPPLICTVVLGTPVSNHFIRYFFENRFFSYLGKISYVIYLWQQLATANYPVLSPWWTLIFTTAVFPFAYLSYEYLERPLIQFGARRTIQIHRRRPP